ncbi:hypothetical protein E1281_06830 [Actinomadura sp. KC345]|uniref:hypothetical protein n=1 Tax=Actinomadura sp. KC345 TaxID=2530371 RepID=UPI00104B2BDF|nr:hypothetical protein [Actinomadura sp. KC345]TDC56566.1 hypothetical protein E1281_06830 [Actinomadura sp. KC345]
MWRARFVLIMTGALACLLTTPAAALERAEPVSRADHLAAELRRNPVYVTDHAPRVLPPDAAERIKASVARLGVPAFVAVTPTTDLGRGGATAADLIALLRDRMREDGIYLVFSPSVGDAAVRQFGSARRLPVEQAWRATQLELPYDAPAPEQVARFVDIALSGKAEERADAKGPRPKSEVRKRLDADDAADRRATYVEWGVFGGGAALSGVPFLALLIRRRTRRASPQQTKRKQAEKRPAQKKPAKGKQTSSKQVGGKQAGKKSKNKGRR